MEEKSNKKKLVFVITKSNWGGAQRYVFDLASAMKNRFAVTVILGGEGPLSEKLKAAGIEIISLPELGRDVSFFKDMKSGWRLFKEFRRIKPDIVHLNSSKIGGIGSLAARLAFVPRIIFTAHGWAWNENRSLIQKYAIAFIMWLTMLWSHRTIAVSQAIKNQVSFFPLTRKKLIVIPHGISSIPFLERKETQIKLLGTTPSDKAAILGSIGELHPIKGHIYAIEAIASLVSNGRDLKYVIYGEGDYRAALEKRIAELGMNERVILAGNVPEAARYLKAFDVFLFPSLSEALGYAVLEAGLASLPVIASAVGGVPEIVDDMESGILIQPKKPGEISAAIELLLEKPELKAKYGTALHEKVVKDFSMERMIEETEKVYINE